MIHIESHPDDYLNPDGGKQVFVDACPVILQTPISKQRHVNDVCKLILESSQPEVSENDERDDQRDERNG